MTVKRIVAANARDALRRVKEVLGADAIVVSNRAVAGGIEITAMSADSLDALSGQVAPRRVVAGGGAAYAEDDDYTVTLSAQARKQQPFRSWQPPRLEPAGGQSLASPGSASISAPQAEFQAAPAAAGTTPRAIPSPTRPQSPVPPPGAGTAMAPGMAISKGATSLGAAPSAMDTLHASAAPKGSSPAAEALVEEIRSIRGLLERQLAGLAWGDLSRTAPVRAELLGEMLESGFSGELARSLVQGLPNSLNLADGRRWLLEEAGRQLRLLPLESDCMDQGGVYAIVGPTGVGKTTTTAKLAARCVLRHGAGHVALVTTDSYRIGAHEQLRVYGRILGVPVHVARDGAELRRTLDDLRQKPLVLVDTVGMSQRDRMVSEQAAMFEGAGDVQRLLLINAGMRGDTLDDVVRAYGGESLAGAILTKVDEAVSLAPAVDTLIRHRLLCAYVANGQRVPEDLHLPHSGYLLHRAFKRPDASSPHRLEGAELAMASPGQQGARHA